ncbi:9246_t:CDS:2 [Cetraspora pellucida]|uniref:9246_t:CDS:1 n=1 Tax=Cetraspora pellucida TaxID=1433469 RepID=A0A9N9BF61_9GLOM|nr:9246_t:CDS:2 [Cetraspora pellucida]
MEHLLDYKDDVKNHLPDFGNNDTNRNNTDDYNLEKKAQYTWIADYYRFNLFVSLVSIYNTIFKKIDSVLETKLAPILLSLQRVQINQALLYQATLVSINQHVNKKVQFGAMMFVAKTSVQVAVSKGVTEELTRVLVQFIMKYYCDTGLDIKKIFLSPSIFFTKVVKQETLPLNITSKIVKLAFNLSLALFTTI